MYEIKQEQPIIFLDIDGVLNSAQTFRSRYEEEQIDINDIFSWYLSDISLSLVQNLNKIISGTGADIVISSSWKNSRRDMIEPVFKAAGVLGKIVGYTPNLPCVRGEEIRQWIIEHWVIDKYRKEGEFTNYVILDDDSDMLLWQKDNFVNVDNKIGLSDGDIEKVFRILRGVYKWKTEDT